MKKENKSSYTKLSEKFSAVSTELERVKNAVPVQIPSEPKSKKKKSSLVSDNIPYVQTLWRTTQDISTFRNALLRAENIQAPNRTELYRLYKDIVLDAHLSSTIQNRKASILSSDFIISRNGQEDEELTKVLLDIPWLYDFINLSLDAKYYGFSLIEFNENFDSVSLIPRQNVKPEFGIFTMNLGDITGPSFLDAPFNDWCIGVGSKTDLGILIQASPLVLWKKNAIIAYSEFCEIFGLPLRVLKLDNINDLSTKQAAEGFMRNMGQSAYAIIGTSDSIEFAKAADAGGSEQMFNGLINTMNSEISKLVLGGTGLMEAKSFVGSADIHQENFLTICGQDRLEILKVLNKQLLPLLVRHGFKFDGCKINIKPEEELSLAEKFKLDSKLLDYYDIPAEYIKMVYGTEVFAKGSLYPSVDVPTEKVKTNTQQITNSIQKVLADLYNGEKE